MPKVSLVIPNWNGRKLLPACLTSVFSQNFTNFEVILVDNGSTDNSVSYVRKNFPQVKIVKLSKNFGFAKAVNLGIEKSLAPFVTLLNNDTKVDINWLKNLYGAILSNPKVFAVASKILQAKKPNLVDSAGDKINIVGQAHPAGYGERSEKFEKGRFVFGATGAASIFRKEILEKLGKFDEDFFFYFEDVDFALRAQIAGFKCWYQPSAVAYHLGGATASKLGNFIEYQRFRNTIFLVIKNFPTKLFFKRGRWWKIPAVFAHTFYFFVKKSWWWQVLRIIFDLLKNFPKLLIKRNKILSQMKVSIDYLDNLMEDKELKIASFRI